jgi:hypothetical protein
VGRGVCCCCFGCDDHGGSRRVSGSKGHHQTRQVLSWIT